MQRIRDTTRRWILGDEAKLRWSSVASLELRLGPAQLNAADICKSALGSSVVLLRSATLRRATLTFSLFSSPMLLLVVEGLRVRLVSRSLDDDFWRLAMQDRTEKNRVRKLASMDPEGAAVYARAERLASSRNSFIDFFVRLFTTFILSALRIELTDVQVSYESDSIGQEACLSAGSVIAPQGSKDSILSGSLLGSAMCIANTARKSPFSKPVTITELSLQFHGTRSTTEPGASRQRQPEHAVFAMMVFVTLNFHQAEFTNVEVSSPDAVFGANSQEVDMVTGMVTELAGPQLDDNLDVTSVLPRERTPRELWYWAAAKALEASPVERLGQTFRGGMVRRRYASLYSEMLQELGWGCTWGGAARPDVLKRLSSDLSAMEKQLPVEAVVLIRRVSRRQWLDVPDGSSYEKMKKIEPQKGDVFSVSIRRGCISFVVCGDGEPVACPGVRLRWSKGCFSCGNSDSVTGFAFACGSMEAELISVSDHVRRTSSDPGEHRDRWDGRMTDRAVFISGSCSGSQQAGTMIIRHNSSLEAAHSAAEQREAHVWVENFPEEEGRSPGKPFLLLEYENASSGGVRAVVGAGKMEVFLSCSMVTRMVPLVTYLKMLASGDSSSTTHGSTSDVASKNFILDKVQVSQYLNDVRGTLFSVVPDNAVKVTMVVQAVSVHLSATDAPGNEAVLELGLVELGLWPVEMGAGPDTEWLMRPTAPVLPSLDGFLQHEQFGFNFVMGFTGAELSCRKKNRDLQQLLKPVTVMLEFSACRDRLSSLLDTFEAISVAVTVAIPSLTLDLSFERTLALYEVISAHISSPIFCTDATAAEPLESLESIQKNRHFAMCFNITAEDFEVLIGDERDAATRFTIGSSWLHCTLGDGLYSSIHLGLQKLEIMPTLNPQGSPYVSLDHLIMAFGDSSTGTGSREVDCPRPRDVRLGLQSGNFECSLEVDIGVLIVAESRLEDLVAKAANCPSTIENMRILAAVEKETLKLILEVEGGLVVVQAAALGAIVSLAESYRVKYVFAKPSPEEEVDVWLGGNQSYSSQNGAQAGRYDVPFRSQSTPQTLEITSADVLEAVISGKIVGISLVVVAERSEGLLLELSGNTVLELQRSCYKVMWEVSQFSVMTLRSQSQQDGTAYRIPEFGNEHNTTRHTGTSSHVRTSSGSSRLDYILERVTVSSSLSRRFTLDPKVGDCWQGRVSITGLDVALTTYEVQMVLSAIVPICSISFGNVSEPKRPAVKKSSSVVDMEMDSCSDLPDGAIISIKDAREHLYLSVEEDPTSKHHYHLGGVWHHSIAGDKALFQVKYHAGGKGDEKWFSLLSLYAKTSDGVPMRVHYRSGCRQVEISSTNDGSWELWQCVPYRADAASELDVYSGVLGSLFHIINQKSKQGLAFVDGIPTFAQHPGSTFKFQIISRSTNLESTVPRINFDMSSVSLTLLHEAAGAEHLLPLVRLRLEEIEGILQVSSCKTRMIAGCNIVLEHFEAQSSSWLSIINPVVSDFVWSSRSGALNKKVPVSVFCRLKKVDIVVSELSLDACLFLIGVMDLAGPFTINHSPVLVNRCQIENQTGVNLLCRFDRGTGKEEEGKIPSWQSNSYLMRHVTSRRGASPAEVSTAVIISLERPGKGISSSVTLPLGQPGVFALRTRLEALEGSRPNSPGPIVVVDISKQSQDGVHVTVSPMVKIHNATGLPLQLRCRRTKEGDEKGAIVTLKDGDIIDDSMGSFDALSLDGEMKKALLSFNVGNFFLSIRPDEAVYDWSDDVKGAKAVRVSGLFEKLHYSFKRTLKSMSLDYSFGSVSCKTTEGGGQSLHFLIRTTRRQVPVKKTNADRKQSLIAWQEQQEMLILPTLRVSNFLSSALLIQVTTLADGGSKVVDDVNISAVQGRVFLYADLGTLSLVLKDPDRGLVSHPIDISTGQKRYQELAKKGGSIKDLDIDVDFKDGVHMALLKVYRADDGVLELSIFTKYSLRNDSQVPVVCCAVKKMPKWGMKRTRSLQWPTSGPTVSLAPNSHCSWLYRSNHLLLKRDEEGSQPAALDFDSLSGSLEISLGVQTISSADKVQLGVSLQVPYQSASSPSHVVTFAPRYTVINSSSRTICVCEDGLEDHEQNTVVSPGSRVAVHAQDTQCRSDENDAQSSSLSLRFRLNEDGWRWSGRICAASLGSFFLKLRSLDGQVQFAILTVHETAASLAINFRLQTSEALPYRIENKLQSGSISFHQLETAESETLPPGSSAGYVWDDLSLQHKLAVNLSGSGMTQGFTEVNLDKVKAWKSFAAAHRNKGFSLQLPFQGQLGGNGRDQPDDLLEKGYEVYADGTTRVLRVCEKSRSTKKNYWQSEMSLPQQKLELKVPIFRVFMIETAKQKIEDLTGEDLSGTSSAFSPFLCAVLTSMSAEALVTIENTFCQFRVQGLGIDMKWQGAPFAAMLRIHDEDRLNKSTIALQAAVVLSNSASNPIQVKYSSLLLQACDLNIDEDTLLKLVPFYRTSLSTASSSRQIYFERFEIHPIKIVASFLPGHPRADYTSAQETFRALLHTVIKLPSVRGATVELNGVLLSHALLTFRQLMMKCVQHYSWYAMRAIYIARGSKLLPPGFASLFDDSAASSLDVFFDPSSGSIDLQGITLGMFNLLSRGLRKKGQGGTSRYLGDLEKTVKKAGSNLVFAVVTELSDNVLKGAEANGFDGMVNGFRRGILNVAMEPRVLQKVVVRGGSTKRIQLDRSVGTDEAYIEGYLQATLDSSFKQDYLKVKVMEDQVVLKNLPPNSMLMTDIVTCVNNFLIGEGLLAGEASSVAVRSLRILRGEQERKIIPAVISLGEQLLVIFAIRGLRQYTKDVFHIPGSWGRFSRTEASGSAATLPPPAAATGTNEVAERPSFKRTVGNFFISSAVAYIDGRLCRHIPNELARRIVSGFLLSFVE